LDLQDTYFLHRESEQVTTRGYKFFTLPTQNQR